MDVKKSCLKHINSKFTQNYLACIDQILSPMADILYDEVPSLDLADFTSGDPVRKNKFILDLGVAYNSIGFVAIRNHYLTPDLSERLYSVIKKFFALPDPVKQQYEIPGLAVENLLSML